MLNNPDPNAEVSQDLSPALLEEIAFLSIIALGVPKGGLLLITYSKTLSHRLLALLEQVLLSTKEAR
jgi:hypothetical protein